MARIAPDPGADPVFRVYDMERQFKTMQMVAEHTDVPVPRVLWLETGTDAIGVPFFVMERVEGIVPPDVMPYTFGDNWFFDADPADQQRLERHAVEVVAALHELTVDGPAGFLAGPDDGESHLRAPRAGAAGLLRLGGVRRRPVAPDRAGIRVARGALARERGRRRASVGATPASGT